MIFLQMPAKEASVLRSRLEGAKPEAIDAILKRPGIEVLADFEEANPWRSEPVELSESMDAIKFGGEVAMDRGIKVELEGSRGTGGTLARVAAEIVLPVGSKGYRQFQTPGTVVRIRPDEWRECSSWGDGKETLMLWRMATSTEPREEKPEDGSGVMGRVEMMWFKVSAADRATLGKSTPETRDKAFTWLTGRGKLWKECVFGIRNGERAMWMVSEGKLTLADGDAIADEARFGLDGEVSAKAGTLEFEWHVFEKEKGEDDETELEISATAAPGIWEFSEIEGIGHANVVAWRCVPD